MATLTSQTIAATYKDLLKIDATSYQAGVVSALRKVEDGDATASALSLGTTSIAIDATDKFYLDGGTHTYIDESAADIMDFYAGGVHMLSLDKTNTEVVINEGSADINFRVEGNGDANLLFCDAGNDRVGIGTGSPDSLVEIEQGSSGGLTLLKLDNDDVDKNVILIEAANTTATVMNIDADALTTGAVFSCSADALTSGNMLYLDDNSASTTARNCVSIIQNNDAALDATALLVQSDAGGTGMKIDKNYPAALVAADTITGLHVDFDHTVPSSGTATQTDIGIDLDVNSATLGTSTTYGMDIDVVGASSGTHTVVGLAVDVGSADTNYAALFNGGAVGVGLTTPTVRFEVGDGNACRFRVSPSDSSNKVSIDGWDGSSSYQDLVFNNNAVTITATNQNVGIGTTGSGTGGSNTVPSTEGAHLTFLHIADVHGSLPAVLNLSGGAGSNDTVTGEVRFSDYEDTDETLVALKGLQSGSGAAPEGGQFEIWTQASAGVLTERLTILHDGLVGIGVPGPTARLHIDQSSASGAMPVLRLDQGDADETFIDFIGSTAGDGSVSISSDTTTDSAKFGAIRIEINGVHKWIRIYDTHS